MIDECVLHIGTGKTGTTSIQKVFSRNRRYLLDHGICYPNPENHWVWAAAFTDGVKSPGTLRLQETKKVSYGEARELGQRFLSNAIELASKRKSRQLVISSEFFFPESPASIANAFELLKQQAESVKILCYVRHPVARGASVFQQRLKMGKITLESYADLSEQLVVADKLLKISEAIGRENLIVAAFDRHQMLNGDVVDDFFGLMGRSDVLNHLERGLKTNESLSREAATIANALNELVLNCSEAEPTILRASKIQHSLMKIGGSKFIPPAHFVEESRKIARDELFKLKEYFGVVLPDVQETQPDAIPGHSFSTDAIKDIAIILNQLHLENDRLRKANANSDK
ncbi:hypothetical protein [Roseovarius pacificus]|uniref:hypothetical protein n=1 Tax=Roseovarius pacificus TaxID=337701 RepID=UPI0040395A3A